MRALLLIASAPCIAQTQPAVGDGPLLAFDQAYVLRSHPAVSPSVTVSPDTGEFFATGVSVVDLVSYAYGTQPSKVMGGPDWIRSARYQIDAWPTAEFVERGDQQVIGQMQELVKGFLLDYFGLTAHEEQSEPAAAGANGAQSRSLTVVIIDQVNEQPADEPTGGFFESNPLRPR